MSNNLITSSNGHGPMGAIVVRDALAADTAAVARLAELDSSVTPAQPILLAEVDGELRAALSLSDGGAVADPFRSTAGLVDVLRTQAGEPSAPRGRIARRFGSGTSRPPQPSAPSIPGIPVMPSATL